MQFNSSLGSFFVFETKISHRSPDWSRNYYISLADLDPTVILLPQPLQCWKLLTISNITGHYVNSCYNAGG